MSRFKDFGAGSSSDAEPISFKLHGEEFFGVEEIQGSVLIDLVADSSSEDAAKAAKVILEFFQHVLTDESYERFDKLIKSKDKIVKVDKLGEIVGWLVEEYTNRPESPAEG
jgi:hypothetical protein